MFKKKKRMDAVSILPCKGTGLSEVKLHAQESSCYKIDVSLWVLTFSKYRLKTLTLTLDSRLCTFCPMAPAFGITPLESAGYVHTMVIRATDEC